MITITITKFSVVYIIITIIFVAMVVGAIVGDKTDLDISLPEELVVAYGVVMCLLGCAVLILLLVGTVGFNDERYFATEYDIETMVDDLRSEGIEVIEKTDNSNSEYLQSRYKPFSGKTKYYWHHADSKLNKYKINQKGEE